MKKTNQIMYTHGTRVVEEEKTFSKSVVFLVYSSNPNIKFVFILIGFKIISFVILSNTKVIISSKAM